MSTVDVLVVVDVENALVNGANGNVYMIDTNGFMGSLGEGGEELQTAVTNGQTIVWSAAPVDPGTNVAIVGFTGVAVGPTLQINPASQQPSVWNSPWSSQVFLGQATKGQTYQYSINLQFGGSQGKILSFDPYVLSEQT